LRDGVDRARATQRGTIGWMNQQAQRVLGVGADCESPLLFPQGCEAKGRPHCNLPRRHRRRVGAGHAGGTHHSRRMARCTTNTRSGAGGESGLARVLLPPGRLGGSGQRPDRTQRETERPRQQFEQAEASSATSWRHDCSPRVRLCRCTATTPCGRAQHRNNNGYATTIRSHGPVDNSPTLTRAQSASSFHAAPHSAALVTPAIATITIRGLPGRGLGLMLTVNR
jgi:hypothetical protein